MPAISRSDMGVISSQRRRKQLFNNFVETNYQARELNERASLKLEQSLAEPIEAATRREESRTTMTV